MIFLLVLLCGGTTMGLGNSTETRVCPPEHYQCASGLCIQNNVVCDRFNDCWDYSDEDGGICEGESCLPYLVECGQGHCIAKTLLCDGRQDCKDGSDEETDMCETYECQDLQHKCNSTNVCLSYQRVCDGVQDCSDGSDEETSMCERYVCQPDQVKCNSTNICINYWRICNDGLDCEDGSDEDSDMCAAHVCYPSEFRCKTADVCIGHREVCEGKEHCEDGSDEDLLMCADYTCDKYQIRCNVSNTCVNLRDVCDGYQECADNSDENQTMCATHQCPSGYHRCGNGRCIYDYWVCNDNIECKDGSDESVSAGCACTDHSRDCYIIADYGLCNKTGWQQILAGQCSQACGYCTAASCPPDRIRCENGNCLIHSSVCDGRPDCYDGRDEDTSMCLNRSCAEHQHQCASNGICLRYDEVCDGFDQCVDGSDEDTDMCATRICRTGAFGCDTGRCMAYSHVCDQSVHCDDGSDESEKMGCQQLSCSGDLYRCLNQRCVNTEYFCDQFDDCGDSSDEPDTCDYRTCDDSDFRCLSGACIDRTLRCDGTPDCYDASDEVHCACASATEFWCFNGVCINNTLVCNGRDDCGDGSDEPLDCGDCRVDLTSKLHDFQLSSSSHESGYSASSGRASDTSVRGWCAGHSDEDPYLQIDFLTPVRISYIHVYNWYECNFKDEAIEEKTAGDVTFYYGNNIHNLTESTINRMNVDIKEEAITSDTSQYGKKDRVYEVNILSQYIQIRPRRSNASDACLIFRIIGCGDTAYVSFLQANDSTLLGLLEVDRVVVSMASAVSLPNTSNVSHCTALCQDSSFCNAAVYYDAEKTCVIYGDNSSDIPSLLIAAEHNQAYQKLYMSVFSESIESVDDSGVLYVKQQVRSYPTILTSPRFVMLYNTGLKSVWNINFTAIDKYPIILFEDFGSDLNVQYTFKSGDNINEKSAHQGMFISYFKVLEIVHHLSQADEVYGTHRTVLTEIRRIVIDLWQSDVDFRAIITASDAAVILDTTNAISSSVEYHKFEYLHIYSDAFLGFVSAYSSEYIIQWAVEGHALPMYLDIAFSLFHVSCGTGTSLKLITANEEEEYCNLQRPWRKMTFAPAELPIRILMFYNQLGIGRPMDGFLVHVTKIDIPAEIRTDCPVSKSSAGKTTETNYYVNTSIWSEIQHHTGLPLMLVATFHDIRFVNLQDKSSTIIIGNLQYGSRTTFLYNEGLIFWSDLRKSSIERLSLSTGLIHTIAREILSDGLACDWIGRKLYWSDQSKNMALEVSELDGSDRKILFHGRSELSDFLFTATELDPLNGFVYWAITGAVVNTGQSGGAIGRFEKAGMDGQLGSTVLFKYDRSFVYGIAVEPDPQRLYWSDAYIDEIYSCDTEGSDCITLVNTAMQHPRGLTVFNDTLYWSDGAALTINQCNKFTGADREVVVTLADSPVDIDIFSPDVQPTAPNPCGSNNGGCSNLCLQSPVEPFYKCACPTYVPLLEDKKTCACHEVCTNEFCYALLWGKEDLYTATTKTREQIEQQCNIDRNGHLASIHSFEELRFVRRHAETFLFYFFRASEYREETVNRVYLGEIAGSTTENKNMYHWHDGTPVVYTAWDTSLSRMRDGCVIMHLWQTTSDNVLNFADCEGGANFYVCKSATNGTVANNKHVYLPAARVEQVTNSSSFMCRSGEMVNTLTVCDGRADCADESDETECLYKDDCEGKFHCQTGGCVPYSMYCDFAQDCADGSDEIYCDFGIAGENQFKCKSGQMVNGVSACNGTFECLDKTDELDCELCSTTNEEKLFSCGSKGNCIPSNVVVCNGFLDCPNAAVSDEEGCTPTHLPSCFDWWKKGYRSTQLLSLTDGMGTVLAECDFEETEHSGLIKTIFHNIDFDSSADLWKVRASDNAVTAGVVYQSNDVVVNLISALSILRQSSLRCKQTFTQTCLPNRQAISNHLDLKFHEEYWDCLCITMTLTLRNLGFQATSSLSSCSDATQQLVDDKVITLEEMWRYGGIDSADTYKFMTPYLSRVNKNNLTYTAGNTSLLFGPISCEERIDSADRLAINTLPCNKGDPVPKETACLYNYDEWGHVIGCSDFTHLQNCENFSCPEVYVKCPGSFCLSIRFHCDGEWDCPNGEDEKNCNNTDGANLPPCGGYFRCRGTTVCLPQNHVCDGKKHCLHGDDERLCDFQCPAGCSCTGYGVTCTHVYNKTAMLLERTMPLNTRILDMTYGKFQIAPLFNLSYIGLLNFSNGMIASIKENTFLSMQNLLQLDLSNNKIRILQRGVFRGLRKIQKLILNNNRELTSIEPDAFEDLISIAFLKISYTKVRHLKSNTFRGLIGLTRLDMTLNDIFEIDDGSFSGLSNLVELNISQNEITRFEKNVFSGLDGLNSLHTDEYVFCCLKPDSVFDDQCTPLPDVFSSCEDLMRGDGPRYLLWIIGIFALVGNCLSFVYRILFERARFKIGYGIFVTNLTISDFLMGLYLIIVAGADAYYRNRYVWNDKTWRNSGLCSLAGFLSTVSCEVSVFFISFITIDRLLAIKYPFGGFRFTTKIATWVSAFLWIVGVLIGIMPLVVTSYFEGKFYATNTVCLALPLTQTRPAGWEYSVAVFIFINFLLFIFIAVGQYMIHQEINKAAAAAGKKKRQSDLTVARNLLLVVMTDFLCWCPIAIMGLMALSGTEIPGEVYVWTTVLVLPINSALNPFLYTFLSILRRKKLLRPKEEDEEISIDAAGVRESVQSGHVYGLDGKTLAKIYGGTAMSLQTFLRDNRIITPVVVIQIVWPLIKQIDILHNIGLCIGDIDPEIIRIFASGSPGSVGTHVAVGICSPPKLINRIGDAPRDVQSFALLTNLLVRACNLKNVEEYDDTGLRQDR